MSGFKFLLLALACLTFAGCDYLAAKENAPAAIHADAAGYWLTAQPSKSDLLPPPPTTPPAFNAPAPHPASPTKAAPAAIPAIRKTTSAVDWQNSLPAVCNGPDCKNCPADCGPNCPAKNTIAKTPARQQPSQRVQSPVSTLTSSRSSCGYSGRRRAGWF